MTSWFNNLYFHHTKLLIAIERREKTLTVFNWMIGIVKFKEANRNILLVSVISTHQFYTLVKTLSCKSKVIPFSLFALFIFFFFISVLLPVKGWDTVVVVVFALLMTSTDMTINILMFQEIYSLVL